MTQTSSRPPAARGPAPGAAPPGPAAASRMKLAMLRHGVRPAPDRILLVGTEGIGKSTFAASAPSPVFIAAEDGVRHLNVSSFPEPRSFDEILEALRVLVAEDHPFKTVVIDTVDWVEPLIWDKVCRRNNWLDSEGNPDIEKPGYGKGYAAATDEWRRFLLALDRVRNERQMEVILLAHASIKTFANPSGPDYNRYECKLQKGAAALLREWCDCNLFAVHEEFVTEAKGLAKSKGVSTGRRLLKTTRTAAWDAKNRHGLPEELPLDYVEYSTARAAGAPASAADIGEEIKRLLEQSDVTDEARAAIGARILAAQGDTTKLSILLSTVRERLAQRQATPAGEAATMGGK